MAIAGALGILTGCPEVGWATTVVSRCVATSQAPGLCPANTTLGSTCKVTSEFYILPGKVIDCSGIDLQITGPNGAILVNTGTFTLLARNLIVEKNRKIQAVSDPVLQVGMEIDLTGSLTLAGQLLAENMGGGSLIAVQADGTISLSDNSPAISVAGTGPSTDGGEVDLIADGAVTIDRPIYANGKDNGDETNINAGGTIWITAGGNVTINEELRATGRWFGGGFVLVESGGDAAVNWVSGAGNPKGTIVVDGKNLTGDAGYISIDAGHSVLVRGPISAAGGTGNSGGESAGGTLLLSAGCGGVDVEAVVDLTGGFGDGGQLITISDGPIVFNSQIDASSRKYGGNGGIILASSGGLIDVKPMASLLANGNDTAFAGEDGQGGLILLSGCSVSVDDETTGGGATIRATGATGGAMSIEGSKKPLAAAAWSVRVGAKAVLDTTGSISNGVVALEVAAKRSGICTNHVTVSCTLDSQCIFGGCDAGTCSNPKPNPDTMGVNTQFKPAPLINQNSTLAACTSRCG